MIKLFLFNGTYEYLGGFECRDIVCRDGHGCLLGDVSCSLLCPVLDDEATEATEVYGVAFDKGTFDAFHESFNNCLYGQFFNASRFGDFINYLSLCHNIYFKSKFLVETLPLIRPIFDRKIRTFFL